MANCEVGPKAGENRVFREKSASKFSQPIRKTNKKGEVK